LISDGLIIRGRSGRYNAGQIAFAYFSYIAVID
jgi:hypothetical protein